jgi:ATP-dependent RNA helicase RhlE
MPFTALGLSPRTISPLARLGYDTPTPVQAQTIPAALQGRDILARAQTGTGKTAAFGLPMIDRLAAVGHGQGIAPRGLVLVPTRELALQVKDSLFDLAQGTRLRVMTMVGGEPIMPQVRTLRRGVDIVVATPGRLIDHLDRKTIDLRTIEIVTLDEADRMLDMGFLPPLKRVMSLVPASRQTLLLSATFSKEIVAVARAFTTDPVRIDVAPEHVVAATVVHRVFAVPQEQKRDVLAHILTSGPVRQTLVFCRTKHGSDRVGRFLEGAGLRTAVIHGDKQQGARKWALDIEKLPLVVNFDLPLVAQDYIHRVGRTGRAGQDGEAISLATTAERALLHDIQKLLPSPIERAVLPDFTPSPVAHRSPHAHAAPRPHDAARGAKGHCPHRGAPSRPGSGRPHGHRSGPRRPGSAPRAATWR